MDHQQQDHSKTQSSSGDHEGLHVHLCNRCGWPFPNPHPSAKHRRAHKRVCEKVEGYKLIDSESANPHSDDDHSDDDPKTPSPKPILRTISKKGSGGIGSASNRSEDEYFSDAVTEFQESGGSSGVEGHLQEASDPSTNAESVIEKDGSSTDHLKGIIFAGDLPSTIQSEVPEVQKIMTDVQESVPGDRSDASLELFDAKPADIQEVQTINANHEVTERSLKDKGPEIDDNRSAEISVDRNIDEIVLEATGNASKILEATDFDKSEKVTSDSTQGVGQLLETPKDILTPDFVGKDDPVDGKNDSVGSVEGGNVKVEGNESVHVLSVPDDLHIVDNAELMLREFKDYRGVNLRHSGTSDSGSESNFITLSPTQLVGISEVFASDTQIVKDGLNDQSGNCSLVDNEVPIEEEDTVYEASKALGGDSKPEAAEVHVEGEAHVVRAEPITEEGSSVLGALASNSEYEGGNQTSVLDDEGNSEKENKLSDRDELNAPEALADSFEHTGEKEKHVVEEALVVGEADVVEPKLAERVNIEHEQVNISFVDKLPVEGKADVPGVKFINDSEFAETKFRSDDHEHESQKREAATDKVSVEKEDLPETKLPNSADKLEDAGGNAKPVIKEFPTEGEVNEPKIELKNEEGSDEPNILTNDLASEIEKSHTFSLPKKHQAQDLFENLSPCDYSLQMDPPGTARDILRDTHFVVAPVDAGVNQQSHSPVTDGAENHKKMPEPCYLAENDKKFTEEKIFSDVTSRNSESDFSISKSQTVVTSSFVEVSNACDDGKGTKEDYDVASAERREASEGNLSAQSEIVGGASSLHESQIILQEVFNSSVEKSEETKYSDRVSETQGGVTKLETKDNKVEGECVDEGTLTTETYHDRDIKLSSKSLEDDLRKEPELASLDTKSSVPSLSTVKNKQASGAGAPGFSSQSLQGEGNDNFVKQVGATAAVDTSVDSSSQADSLDGNWGSVSVLSVQSDTTAAIDTEDRANSQKPKGPPEVVHSDKPEMFEPPSFMTLVEPRGANSHKSAEIQTLETSPQQKAASLQASWFPSITNVANDSQGRKKNEEIIAKVTNWSAGKQHTPLKNLLGEANREAKPKSPKPKENQASFAEKVEPVVIDDVAVASKVSSKPATKAAVEDPGKSETAKEWNSPARYPADIKREKRKVKGRPYWAQFVCCSSVN